MSTTQHQVAKGQPSGPKSQYEASREAQIDAYLAGSDSRATDTAAIQHRTLKCHALFESCQSNSNRSGDDWLDKMSAEFNWWSLGIGAAKGGHSSLDYRVQTREDVRNTLVNLLESLATSLNKYIDAVSQLCQFTATPTQEQTLERAAAHGSNVQSSGDNSLIDEQRYYIETTIRFLSQISIAIRKSGTKFRHQRVDKLMTARESDLKEFRGYMQSFLLMSPTKAHTLHGILHQHSLTGDPLWKSLWITLKAYFTDIQRLTPVQNRLMQANLVRRNRFDLYLVRYHRKVRVQKGPQLLRVQAATAFLSPKEPLAPAPSQSRVSQTTPKRDDKIPTQPLMTKASQRSSQSATKIGSFVMPQRPQEQKARSVSTKPSQGVLKQDYPKCPGAEGESFWCPYCVQLLDSSYSDPKKNKRWRGHVVEDLSPYVCIYDDCDSPDSMYVTTVEWKKHIRDRHSKAQWICDPCWLDSDNPEEFEFESEEEWRKHTLTEHGDEVDESDLPDYAEVSQRTGVPPIACPLCYEDTSLRNPETDKHLAEHLHSFALQALPWEFTGCDETQASMGSSDIGKSESSADSTVSTTKRHSDDDDEVTSPESLVNVIKSLSSLLLKEGQYPGTSNVPALLATIAFYFDGPSSRFNDHHPSFLPEISASLARLGSIMQRHEDQSSDFKEQNSIDIFEQDLLEAFTFLKHLAYLSDLEFTKSSTLHGIQSPSDTGVPKTLDVLGPSKARDPENWDIDSSDRVIVGAPTVKRILPYERNSQFVARPELSTQLLSILPTSSSRFCSAALLGVGGSGKTQLALEYAYARCDDSNCSVFWVRADSAATFVTDYRRIAKELDIEQHLEGDDLLAAVCSEIEAHQPWVLIIDGADDLSLFKGADSEHLVSLFDFVPKGPRGTVLWTTCDADIGWLVPKPPRCLQISSMRYTEAALLLASTRGPMARHQEPAGMGDEISLLEELECLPIAIMQAGAYMRHTSTPLHDYMSLLRSNKQRLELAVSERSLGVVTLTSAISLDWIRQRNGVADEMVHVLAYLDNRSITLDLLSELGGNTETFIHEEHFSRRSTATEELATLHLISPADSGCQTFEMHQLVQKAVRGREDAMGAAFSSISSATALKVATRHFYLNHVVKVCGWAAICRREIYAADLLSTASGLLDDEERWREKELVDRRALEFRESKLGEWNSKTISSSMSLAAALFQQGRCDKAAALATKVLEMRQRSWGKKNLYTMKSRVAIGMIYHQQGRYDEAEAAYNEVLRLQTQGSELEITTRPLIVGCLAWTYYMQGRYEEAEVQLDISWTLHRKLQGVEHPDTLQALHHFAVIVHLNGRPHRGIELMQSCVEMRRTVLGFAHPLTNVSTLLLEEWKAEERDSQATE